jgi:hypothetical protein
LKGVKLAKRTGTYKSEKRKKELLRQKKQEEKRQKRLNKNTGRQYDTEFIDPELKDKEQNT